MYSTPKKTEMISPMMLAALMAAYNQAERSEAEIVTHHHGRPVTQCHDPRGQRMHWAWLHLGKRIESFKDLTRAQGGYLLDLLNARETFVDKQLSELFIAKGIRDQRAWFFKIVSEHSRSKLMWQFGARNFDALTYIDKWTLVNILKTRAATTATA